MLTEQNIGDYATIKAVRRNIGGCSVLIESFDGKQKLVAEYPDVVGRKLAFQRAVRDGKLRHFIATEMAAIRKRYEWAEQVRNAEAQIELEEAADELGITLNDECSEVCPYHLDGSCEA